VTHESAAEAGAAGEAGEAGSAVEAGSAGSASPARADLLPLGIGLGVFAACVWRVRHFVTDDAYISLRYARNLAAGHGPVWNPGGPHTEGFSNPLLVFAEAAVHRVWTDAAPAFVRGLGVLCGLLLVLAVWYLARPVLGPYAANAATVLVGATPAFAFWAVGGLETLPIVLVAVVATLLLALPDGGPPALAAALLATLPWLRPEGLGLAAALVAASELGGLLRGTTRRATVRRLAWLAGLPLLSQAALQALRWVWFGHLLPNSVVYKTAPDTLGAVTGRFVTEIAPIAALAAVGFVLVRGRARLLAAIPATYVVASVTFEDSVNAFSRLVLPALPLLVLLAAAALPGALTLAAVTWQRGATVLSVGVAALASYVVVVGPVSVRHIGSFADDYMACRAFARQEAGEWLREKTGRDEMFAIGDAGLTPYLAERTTYDLFHLNEASIQETGPLPAAQRAARAHDAEPDHFVLASLDPDTYRHVYGTERHVVAHEGFADYELAAVVGSDDEGCDYHLFVFSRTDPDPAP
jgi:arabinofuranosyltransferase